MTEQLPPPPRERNPGTERLHKQDVFWQITMPLVGLLLLFGILGGLVIGSTATDWGISRNMAHIATIWMSLPVLFALLVFLLILAGITYGVVQIINVLPFHFKTVQDQILKVNQMVKEFAAHAANPVVELRSRASAAERAVRSLRSIIDKLTE